MHKITFIFHIDVNKYIHCIDMLKIGSGAYGTVYRESHNEVVKKLHTTINHLPADVVPEIIFSFTEAGKAK